MTGLDTNVLVRYLVQDHPSEGKKAADFIQRTCTREEPGFINQIVLCELVWVLESAYAHRKDLIEEVLEKILSTVQLEVEGKDVVWAALEDYRSAGADFSDCLIGRRNRSFGVGKTVSFDRGTKKLETFALL